MPPHSHQAILFPMLLSYIHYPTSLENHVQSWFAGAVHGLIWAAAGSWGSRRVLGAYEKFRELRC